MRENGHRPLQVVSFFEHERERMEDIAVHLAEFESCTIERVVYTLSEETLRRPDRLYYLEHAIEQTKAAGIQAFVDPWTIGKAFGGEGRSAYADSRKLACVCQPEFNSLMHEWTAMAAALQADGVFLDEAESHCPGHTDIDLAKEYSEYAAEHDLFVSVCIPANFKKVGQLNELAKLETVDEIGTDPYWPNVFTHIPPELRHVYVRYWANKVMRAARAYGKQGGTWLQQFGIAEGDTGMISEFAQIMQESGVDYLAAWGYRGCAVMQTELRTGDGQRNGYSTPQENWQATHTIFSHKPSNARQPFSQPAG